jgi:riboflavin biosynthesis pyrimidine reductase
MLIGAGTFSQDNPTLNVRHPRFPGFENKVVLLDPTGRCLPQLAASNLFKVRDPKNVFVVLGPDVQAKPVGGVSLLRVKASSSGQLDVLDLCHRLREQSVHSVMIEGGPVTIASFLSAGLVRRLHHYSAPLLIGSTSGRSWTEGFGAPSLASAVRLEGMRYKRLGCDLYSTGRVVSRD